MFNKGKEKKREKTGFNRQHYLLAPIFFSIQQYAHIHLPFTKSHTFSTIFCYQCKQVDKESQLLKQVKQIVSAGRFQIFPMWVID